jgi:hypothetical protein
MSRTKILLRWTRVGKGSGATCQWAAEPDPMVSPASSTLSPAQAEPEQSVRDLLEPVVSAEQVPA